MRETVKVKLRGREHRYKINIGSNLLADCGSWAKKHLSANARKIVVISNAKVFSLYGEAAVESLKEAGFTVFVWKMGDGERFKSFRSIEKLLKFLSEKGLTRSDAVIALGGGVVGDLAGFAASVFLRGVQFLQIPTTLLSMIDSSVGGKTGVNSSFGKNLIGAFHQPAGVLIDVNSLKTLPRRELTAGFCEAVKHGAISNRSLFDQTHNFLKNYPTAGFRKHFVSRTFLSDLHKLIAAQVSFKAQIVSNDELEQPDRTDSLSRKILNFGHTVAHSLEKITDYKYFKHGEAVGYGILAAGEIAKEVANFDQNELNLLNDVVRLSGNLPDCRNIRSENIIEAFKFDKKNIGESMQWILLKQIGEPIIFSGSNIPKSTIVKSINKILGK